MPMSSACADQAFINSIWIGYRFVKAEKPLEASEKRASPGSVPRRDRGA